MELELKRIDDLNKCWILHCKEALSCRFCGKPVREGYFCKVQEKVWHKECFERLGFDCHIASWKREHQDFCVVVKLQEQELKEAA